MHKLEADGHLDIHAVRERQYFRATDLRSGKTSKFKIDAATGMLPDEDDD